MARITVRLAEGVTRFDGTELSETKAACQYCRGKVSGYTCVQCGKVQRIKEDAKKDEDDEKEPEMCVYCSHRPVDPKHDPYCSSQCATNAQVDNDLDEDTIQDIPVGSDTRSLPVKANETMDAMGMDESDEESAGGVYEDAIIPTGEHLEKMVQKAMPRKNSISVSQMAEKLSLRLPWMGPDGMAQLRLEVSYAMANLAERNFIRRVSDRMGANRFERANIVESTTEVHAGKLGFRPLMKKKGRNQHFEFPKSISYGGRSWTKNESGGEHWDGARTLGGIKYADRYGNILHVSNALDEDWGDAAVPLRCDCPDDSVDHEAHDCQNDATYKVVRDGRTLYLCGDCVLSGDREQERVGHGLDEDAIEDKPSITTPDNDEDEAMPTKKPVNEGYYMIHYTDGSTEKFEGSASAARAKAAKSSKQIDDIETLSKGEFTAEGVSVKRFGTFLTEDAKCPECGSKECWNGSHCSYCDYKLPAKKVSEAAVSKRPEEFGMKSACAVCGKPATWYHAGRDQAYCDNDKPNHAMQRIGK